MKQSTVFAALVLVASMLFGTVSSFAAISWTSAPEISSVSISLVGNNYDIAMTLGNKPTSGTNYSILFGNSNDVLNSFTYSLDAFASMKSAGAGKPKILSVGFSADNVDTGTSIPLKSAFWDNNKTLNWTISKDSIFKGGDFWFAGQSLASNGTFSATGATKATVTPIPGAAWLLGSGICGLVALRRRRSQEAA